MEERIYNIISNAIKNLRLITQKEILEIFYIFREVYDLDEVLNDIIFTPTEKIDRTNPHYAIKGKYIFYYYDYYVEKTSDNNTLNRDFYLLHSLFHELMHAKQEKQVHDILLQYKNNNSGNDILDCNLPDNYILLSNSFFNQIDSKKERVYSNRLKKLEGNNVIEKYRNYYNQNHDIFPLERFADLDALFYLRKILFKYEKEEFIIKIYHDMISKYLSTYLFEGYTFENNKLKSPTMEIFDKLGDLNDKIGIRIIQHELDKKSTPTSKMLYLGLNISVEDFMKLKNYYKRISEIPSFEEEFINPKQLLKK